MKLTRKVLHKVAKPCRFDSPFQNQKLADEMVEFMRRSKGIGLAASQIGLSRRLFVMAVDGNIRICFNPEILEYSQNLTGFEEGCLSFPGESCILTRPETLVVRYQDSAGSWIQTKLEGLEARCFQHELDHLDGITMHDRLKEQHAAKS